MPIRPARPEKSSAWPDHPQPFQRNLVRSIAMPRMQFCSNLKHRKLQPAEAKNTPRYGEWAVTGMPARFRALRRVVRRRGVA